ncbi:MAG TPA: hypothetical protein VEJ18_03955, partial [Planctomycetota bacterium]|nr:hypothetical protein [Planctomycetota bacterium]
MLTYVLPSLLALAMQDPPNTPPPDAETIEIRLYLIRRDRVPFDFRDAAAFLALRTGKGESRTIPMEIVRPKENAKETVRGQVRQLEGTPMFVDLRVSPGARASEKGLARPGTSDLAVDELVRRSVTLPTPPAQEKKLEANGHPPAAEEKKEQKEENKEEKKEEPAAPSLDAWIDEVYAGPYFRAVVPAGSLPAAFDASVTVRGGNLSWTARGFRHPADEPLADVVQSIEEDLKAILRHTEALEFGRVPVVTVRIRERLTRLSGLSLRDRNLEYARAWLYRLLDQMDQATRTGDEAMQTIVGTFYSKMEPLRT